MTAKQTLVEKQILRVNKYTGTLFYGHQKKKTKSKGWLIQGILLALILRFNNLELGASHRMNSLTTKLIVIGSAWIFFPDPGVTLKLTWSHHMKPSPKKGNEKVLWSWFHVFVYARLASFCLRMRCVSKRCWLIIDARKHSSLPTSKLLFCQQAVHFQMYMLFQKGNKM